MLKKGRELYLPLMLMVCTSYLLPAQMAPLLPCPLTLWHKSLRAVVAGVPAAGGGVAVGPPTVLRTPSAPIDSVGLPDGGYIDNPAPKASVGMMMIPVPGESSHIGMTVIQGGGVVKKLAVSPLIGRVVVGQSRMLAVLAKPPVARRQKRTDQRRIEKCMVMFPKTGYFAINDGYAQKSGLNWSYTQREQAEYKYDFVKITSSLVPL